MFNRSLKIFLPLVLFSIITSCYKKQEITNTATVDMSGEWWVEYFLDADPATSLAGFNPLLTYNTSDNTNSQIWIEDHTWPFKSKAAINYSTMSFPETASTENLESPGTFVKILEGKVVKNGGHSQSGVIVDSIFLRVEFLDEDPGNVYQIRGHMKTGFFEDEY